MYAVCLIFVKGHYVPFCASFFGDCKKGASHVKISLGSATRRVHAWRTVHTKGSSGAYRHAADLEQPMWDNNKRRL